jgi:cell division protein FtsL
MSFHRKPLIWTTAKLMLFFQDKIIMQLNTFKHRRIRTEQKIEIEFKNLILNQLTAGFFADRKENPL